MVILVIIMALVFFGLGWYAGRYYTIGLFRLETRIRRKALGRVRRKR
jgi:hypothetical protein